MLSGVNTDVALPAGETYSVYRIVRPTTGFSIDGVSNGEALADGQIVRLINTTNNIMTIVHNNNINFPSLFKIACPSETNLVLPGKNPSVTLQYNKTLSRWTVAAYAISNIITPATKKYSVFASTAIAKSNGLPQDMEGLILTFTLVNSIVYVTYNIYGDVNPGNASGNFHLLMNGSIINNTEMRTDILGKQIPYHATLPMFPLRVSPGVQITIKVQLWKGDGNNGGTIHNNLEEYPCHGRYITVID